MCDTFDIGCKVTEAAAGAFEKALDKLSDMTVEAAGQAVQWAVSWWVHAPTPGLGADGEPSSNVQRSEFVGFIQDHLWFYMAGMMVLSLIIGGLKMALDQNAKAGRDLLKSLVTVIGVVGASNAVIAFGVYMGDQFSTWVIREAIGDETNFAEQLEKLITDGDAFGKASGGALIILTIILMTFAMLAGLVQYLLMLVRAVMLILLAGVLPLTGSFTNLESGRAWFRKSCAWTLAFLLYKPTAALIYAVSFKMINSNVITNEDGPANVVMGVLMLFVAIFALPALIRFVTPLTAAVAGGAGGMAMAGGSGGGASPSGATQRARSSVQGNGGGSGGGSATGSSSRSGGSSSGATGPAGPGGGSGSPGKAGAMGKAAPAGAPAAGGGGAAAAGGGGAAAAGGGGAAAAGGGAAAAGGGAAAAGGTAGAAGGPVGVGVGVAAGATVGAAYAAGKKTVDATRSAAETSASGAAQSDNEGR